MGRDLFTSSASFGPWEECSFEGWGRAIPRGMEGRAWTRRLPLSWTGSPTHTRIYEAPIEVARAGNDTEKKV